MTGCGEYVAREKYGEIIQNPPLYTGHNNPVESYSTETLAVKIFNTLNTYNENFSS